MITIYSRYYGLQTLELNGKIYHAQRTITFHEKDKGAIEHTLIGEETLDQLAVHYYGREDLWWRIADANKNTFPLDWQAGDKLLIPPIAAATRTPR